MSEKTLVEILRDPLIQGSLFMRERAASALEALERERDDWKRACKAWEAESEEWSAHRATLTREREAALELVRLRTVDLGAVAAERDELRVVVSRLNSGAELQAVMRINNELVAERDTLRTRVEALEAALEPFASAVDRLHISEHERDGRTLILSEAWGSRHICSVGDLRRARSILSAKSEAGGWRPIETAPDDGRDILTWSHSRNRIEVRSADGEYWRTQKVGPKLWYPLPSAPNSFKDDK